MSEIPFYMDASIIIIGGEGGLGGPEAWPGWTGSGYHLGLAAVDRYGALLRVSILIFPKRGVPLTAHLKEFLA